MKTNRLHLNRRTTMWLLTSGRIHVENQWLRSRSVLRTWGNNQHDFSSLPSETVAMHINNVIDELNKSTVHVSAVMSDNCPSMRKLPSTLAYQVSEQKFGRILKVGCGSHILNLITFKWYELDCVVQTKTTRTLLCGDKERIHQCQIQCRAILRQRLLSWWWEDIIRFIPFAALEGLLLNLTEISSRCHKGIMFMRQVKEMASFCSVISKATWPMEKLRVITNSSIVWWMNGIRVCSSVDAVNKQKMIEIMDHYYMWIDIKLAKCLYYVNYNADRDGPLNTTYMEDACIFLESYCRN